MNICLVSREYPPETDWGGIGAYTYYLANGLAAKGYQVHVICQSLDFDKEYMDDKVYVHRVSHKNRFYHKRFLTEFALRLEYSLSVFAKLKEIIKKYNIDIVESPNLSAESIIYTFSKKAPLVTRLHTAYFEVVKNLNWPMSFDRRLSCLLEDTLILKSDLVSCSTNAHATKIVSKIKIDVNKIKIIPLGVGLPPLAQGYDGGNSKDLEVLFVGRLEKRKGVHVLLEAVPLILEEIPNVQFILIGRDTFVSSDYVSFSGPKERSFKESLLNSLAAKYKKNVHFLGYIRNEDLFPYFRSCNLFVAPSLYESFGLVYIEAMSYGKPVVATNVGGIPEVVSNERDGILVEPNNSESLAQAIIRLLKDKELNRFMGQNARRTVEQRFTREIMAENTLAAYKEILSN